VLAIDMVQVPIFPIISNTNNLHNFNFKLKLITFRNIKLINKDVEDE